MIRNLGPSIFTGLVWAVFLKASAWLLEWEWMPRSIAIFIVVMGATYLVMSILTKKDDTPKDKTWEIRFWDFEE